MTGVIDTMKSYRIRWAVGLIAVGAALLSAASIWAAQFVPLSIEEMTARAEAVVHGQVLSSQCLKDSQNRIYTQIQLQVIDVWKGKIETSPLTVVHGGGTLDGRTSKAEGQVQYAKGEEVVLFAVFNDRKEAVTLGLAQGKFAVSLDEKSGVKKASNLFYPLQNSTSVAKQKNSHEEDLTLDVLKTRVKKAVQ